MTHTELVQRAEKWLRGRGYGVVLTELQCYTRETPDAIGFKHDHSALVECKASRVDFLRDKRKWFRREMYAEHAMGTYRFYMCPEHVIEVDDLPEKWGLIWVDESGKCRLQAGPKGNIWSSHENQCWMFHERDVRSELTMVVSALRRLQHKEDTTHEAST